MIERTAITFSHIVFAMTSNKHTISRSSLTCQHISSKKYLYVFVVVALIPLFFIDLPFDTYPRSIMALWDLGHILFFSFFIRIISGNQISNTFSLRWSGKAILSVLIIGVLIEIIQSGLSGRINSLNDVLRDLCGGILGLVWVNWKNVSLKIRPVIFVFIFLLLAINIVPLCLALTDEKRARDDFPVLSTFENAAEISRWEVETTVARVKKPTRQGQYSLRVFLTTKMYSGIGLKYFPNDWRGMRELRLSIFNPDSSELEILFSIYDRQHTQGQQLYSDRFNRTILMPPGWTDVCFLVDEIVNAPKDRKMDLEDIDYLGLFVNNLKADKVIYIDDVRLVE